MSIKKWLLALVAAGVGASLYTSSRRSRQLVVGGLLPAPAAPTSVAADETPTSESGVGSESPNPAESLQSSHQGGAFAGIAAGLPDGGTDAELLPTAGANESNTGGANNNITPGLPDMFRGA